RVGEPDTAVAQADGCNCAYTADIELKGLGTVLFSDCTTSVFNFTYTVINSSSVMQSGQTISHTLDPRFSFTTSAASLQTSLRLLFGNNTNVSITSSGGGTNNVLSISNIVMPLGNIP